MQNFIEYQDSVLKELEKLEFPKATSAAIMMGVPHKAIADFIHLMSLAYHMQGETTENAAIQIADIFMTRFKKRIEEIILRTVKFPSE